MQNKEVCQQEIRFGYMILKWLITRGVLRIGGVLYSCKHKVTNYGEGGGGVTKKRGGGGGTSFYHAEGRGGGTNSF